MGNTIATPPQSYRAEKTPADADHEFSKKNQKNRRKNSDDYNNNHDDDDDERKTISMSTERKKKRKRVYSSNNNNNNNNIKPRTGIKLIPRPKLEEFVDNNMGSEKSVLIQQLRETFNLDLRQAHNQYYNHIKPILASLDKSSYQLQDDVLESSVPSEWTDDDDDDDDVIKASTSKKKCKISQFGHHEIGHLVETDMTLMVAPENKQCRSEGCTKYKKSSYHDGYCLSCYREHYGSDATTSITESSSSSGIGNLPIPLNKKHYGSDATPNTTESSSNNSSNNHPIQTMATTTTGDGGPPKSAKYCIFDGCMKHKQKGCFGYCLTHKAYANPEQHRLQNELAAVESAMKKSTMPRSNFCKFEGCDKYKQANYNGYCLQHVKSNVAYEDDDLEVVTKVRVRCDTRLQNGFCVAIFSDESRSKLGLELERPPPMSCDEEDDDDEGDEEMDQGEDTSPAAESGVGNKVVQPEFKISNQIRRKENGALLCKAVGCPKIAQTKQDGFCRNHFNRFIISTGQCESWECKCGERIAVTSLRCGVCHRSTTNGVPLQINWIAIPEKFEQNCNALREFLILRQKLPSNNSEDKNEKKLYTFINNQRHQQQQNNLDPAREALLNSINRGILAYRREYVPSEEGREIEQAGDVPGEEHTAGDNNNNCSTEDNVAAIKTEYEADTDDDTPTVNKTDRKDLKVKIKSEYEDDTDDDADAKVDGIKISQGKLSPRHKRLHTSEGAEIGGSPITTMVNRDNSRKKATQAKKSSGCGAKKKIKDDTQILMTQRENDFNEKTWWMNPLGREGTSRQGATVLMKRCMRTHGWNEMKTRKVLNAYHQFITLKKEHEDWDAKILSPCYLVDQMWHSHILDVVNYYHDMMLLCGRVVGHDPDGALDYVAKQKRDETTRKALQERFGSYDEEVWNYSPDETHGKREEEKASEVAFASEPISIIIQDQTGEETKFIMKRNTKMNKVFQAYVDRKGCPLKALLFRLDYERIWKYDTRKRMFYFLLNGKRIDDCLTPEELELKDGDQIDVMLIQSGC